MNRQIIARKIASDITSDAGFRRALWILFEDATRYHQPPATLRSPAADDHDLIHEVIMWYVPHVPKREPRPQSYYEEALNQLSEHALIAFYEMVCAAWLRAEES